MKLSAPVYKLKSRAKSLKYTESISMLAALDSIANEEGYASWSLLQSKASELLPTSDEEILAYLNPGDLMLVGSRPNLGKTNFTLKMLVQAAREGRRTYFFSLDFTLADCNARLKVLLDNRVLDSTLFTLDCSDEISSGYVIETTKSTIQIGSLIVIDYLQLLDQKRSNPAVQLQLEALKKYAVEKGCIVVCLSQVDRSFESKKHLLPGIDDIRMPNCFDPELFNKVVLISDKSMRFVRPASFEIN